MKQSIDKETVIMIALLIIVIIAVIISTFIFFSYQNKEKKVETPVNSKYYIPTESETSRAKELKAALQKSIPSIDGTVNTIALDASIISKLTGENQEKSEMKIIHTNYEQSFLNLLANRVDVIFTGALTEEQRKEAASKNIALKMENVAKEGIVFVVNSNNPVQSLTQEQIIDIYSGKITNWQDVGGNDEKIIVYQSKENTDEYKFMKEFMQDSNLIESIVELLPNEGGIIESIATYDNSENAIGYMIYTYSADMLSDEIKFINIDGIAPTKETMVSEEYPLLYDIYGIYNNEKSSTKTSDELIEWLLTYEGQEVISNAGYIPVKNVETKENLISKYENLGTGKEQAILGDFKYVTEKRRLL